MTVIIYLDLHYPMQSVHSLYNMDSISIHFTVYKTYPYVIKFASDLWSFSPGTRVSSTNKTDAHDIT
jgi:hypothetical protein